MAIRGWTWLDDCDLTEDQMDENEPLIKKIVARLNAISEEREYRMFSRDYNEADEDFETEAELNADRRWRSREADAEQCYVDSLHADLETLGARLMRPYEHHNEMESYYSRMEG